MAAAAMSLRCILCVCVMAMMLVQNAKAGFGVYGTPEFLNSVLQEAAPGPNPVAGSAPLPSSCVCTWQVILSLFTLFCLFQQVPHFSDSAQQQAAQPLLQA